MSCWRAAKAFIPTAAKWSQSADLFKDGVFIGLEIASEPIRRLSDELRSIEIPQLIVDELGTAIWVDIL